MLFLNATLVKCNCLIHVQPLIVAEHLDMLEELSFGMIQVNQVEVILPVRLSTSTVTSLSSHYSGKCSQNRALPRSLT